MAGISARPARFGSLYEAVDGHGTPRTVKATSIYDLERTDRPIIDELTRAAEAADRQAGKDAHATPAGDYTALQPFVADHHVFVATGEEAERIHRAYAMPLLLGMLGRSSADRLLRRIEKIAASVMRAESGQKLPMLFRAIRETVPAARPAGNALLGFLRKLAL